MNSDPMDVYRTELEIKYRKLEKALELWKRLFERRDHPYWASADEYMAHCFFCGEEIYEPHTSDCIWIEAKKLVEEQT